MLKKLDRTLPKRATRKRQKAPVVELVSVSKWQDIIAQIDRRYARNESLQTLIELLIVVNNARSIAKGSILGKPLEPLLNGISVSIARGSVVGVIDIGGQSRNALLTILANSEPPSLGEVRYFGKMAAFEHIGTATFAFMTCRELLVRGAREMGVEGSRIRVALSRAAKFSGLGDQLDIPLRRLPKWTLTDLGISFLCCLDYDVIVANEMNKPFSEQVASSWEEYLLKAPTRGKTVIMSSRNLRGLLKRSTHLLLIENAGLLDYGEKSEIKSRHRTFIEEACSTPIALPKELGDSYDDEDEME